MSPLPSAMQQTVDMVQRHYEMLQDQVTHLQSENKELKKRLQRFSNGDKAELPGTIVDVSDSDFDNYKIGSPTSPVASNPSPPRNSSIKMVDSEMLEKELARKKMEQNSGGSHHSREAEDDEDEPLSANKFNLLKSDPFPTEEEDDESNEKGRCSSESMVSFFYSSSPGSPMQKATNSIFFKTLSTFAIAANTLYLAIVADYNVKNSYRRLQGLPKQEAWTIPDIIFTAWFTIELMLMIIAHKGEFFFGDDRAWNIFDVCLVSESLFSLIMTFAGGKGLKLSFLRIFRVFRLVRVVRVVRTVKALARLRTMIFAILNSFVDLLWAFLVVLLILLVFAIVFAAPVGEFFDKVDLQDASQMAEAENLNLLFGSMLESMVSLWSAVSGGNDWMSYGEPVRRLPGGDMYFIVFNFFIAFCVVGLFNVVTGVFVDSAVCCRTGDEVVAGYLEDLKNTTQEIKGFFKEADRDGSGTLSWEEFQEHMKNPAVKAYFSGLDIDPEEADTIFTILDADQNCELVIDELVNGTMKLKGAATKLDLMTLMYDLTDTHSRSEKMWAAMQSQLHDIRRRLPQARTDAHGKDLPRAVAIARRL
mmetsp:Transcript_97382/g.173444  ORF Transcript_97382/g.173444 Transcript_97382/m.173444 type:complete len:589 (-) Transcript_97382:59-1825(-)